MRQITAVLGIGLLIHAGALGAQETCFEWDLDRAHPLYFDNLREELQLSRVGMEFSAERFYQKQREMYDAWIEYKLTERDVAGPLVRDFEDLLRQYIHDQSPRFKWMKGEMTPIEIWYEAPESDSSVKGLKVPCSDATKQPANVAIRHFADALERYGYEDVLDTDAMELAAKGVTAVYTTHMNKLQNGLPMWPWEHPINGVSAKKDWNSEEPKAASLTQWIALRPTVAPTLRFSGEETSEVDLGVVVEVGGRIWYKKQTQFKKWHGFSVIAALSGDNGIGWGAAYRNQSLLIGAAHHNDIDDWLLYVTVDFYQLVFPEGEETNQARAFLEAFAKSEMDKLRSEGDD